MNSRHGIAVPLSALHTNQSSGIGEFLDLLPLIDWCTSVHMNIIQLLPINDTQADPSPYNPTSSCALNLIYISLYALPDLTDDLKERLPHLHQLTQLPWLAYHKVYEEKMNWLHDYYKKNHTKILNTPEFEQFHKKHPWLSAYCDYKQEAPFHQMLQYLAFSQMKQVKEYAHKKGVALMGDIPILISRSSVDVQTHPEWFKTYFSAGAPPDMLNQEGQSWGFPLYNWDAMKSEGYSFWKIRLQTAAELYDCIRIDHIVGFFRIWAIEHGKPPNEGKFIPEDESLWMDQGKEILGMMCETTALTLIGEDLGTVPPESRAVMKELGIYGTKVMRWERNWEGDQGFIPHDHYPPLSVTTVSTHDSETLEQWWKNEPEEAKAFTSFKKRSFDSKFSFDQRYQLLNDSHHTTSLMHINLLQEYLALIPELIAQDPNEERINIPGIPHPYNWLYRYRPSVEDLLHNTKLNKLIMRLLLETQ